MKLSILVSIAACLSTISAKTKTHGPNYITPPPKISNVKPKAADVDADAV